MADQKAMKKRLKLLMQKPENQVCSDCPERQPRWASLIVPPPGSPPGSTAIGAFCCLECSGSHRRLGVHISFVRSINLDSWKEKEVLAMENGGNRKVNAIWEANLEKAGGRKPPVGADLNTRERYIRDKYERRKFYDHQALVDYQNSEPNMDDLVTRQRDDDFANFGPPPEEQVSDAARLRAEKKKKAAPDRSGSFEAPARSRSGGGGSGNRRRAKKSEAAPAPATAPAPEVDLLDLGSGGGDTQPASTSNDNNQDFDFFGADSNGSAQEGSEPTRQPPRRQKSSDGSRQKGSRSRSREEGRTKSRTPERDRKSNAQDILNMYNTPMGAGHGFGAGQNNNNTNNNNMMSMMNQMQNMSMNQQQQQAGGKYNSRLAMHQTMQFQNQQQPAFNPQLMQQMFQQNPQMMQQMMQQMGMSPQMMQQMMAMNQNMMQGGGMNNMQMGMNANNNMTSGGMNNGSGGMYNNSGSNMMGMGNNNMMNHQQQNNQFGGAPMGSGQPISSQGSKANKKASDEKKDPFADFGMNAFR